MVLKSFVVLTCLLIAVVCEKQYSTKYDNVNIDDILSNRRLLLAYTDCVLEKGKCTAEGKDVKAILQDAIETGCGRCTDAQIQISVKLMNHLIKHERATWDELNAKFDPQGVWRKQHEALMRKRGVVFPED